MNNLSPDLVVLILNVLVEGLSLRATSRLTGCSLTTILRHLCRVGAACEEYQDQVLRNLPCAYVQVDELFATIYAKDKNVAYAKAAPEYAGENYTFVAMCADTKLVLTWFTGRRDELTTKAFMTDLVARLKNRVQLTSDGFRPYPRAVKRAFKHNVDYARLVKLKKKLGKRELYAGSTKTPVLGNPKIEKISTSYIERVNLTIRMGIRRFTRDTNAFSKKLENHAYMIAFFFMYYNFGRIHETLRITPAMAAGISDHVWSMQEIIALANQPLLMS